MTGCYQQLFILNVYKQEVAVTAAGNFGLWRCCFFCGFHEVFMGAWEVLTGTVTFLMWEYDRGMVKVGKQEEPGGQERRKVID